MVGLRDAMSARETGWVSGLWRGSYGFLRPDGAPEDLFVHVTALEHVDELAPGQRVSFERGTDRQGRPCADAVRLEGHQS